MTFLIASIAILSYLATGAFFCGFIDDGDWLWFWCWLWPIMIALFVLSRAMEYISILGEFIRDALQSYFERE